MSFVDTSSENTLINSGNFFGSVLIFFLMALSSMVASSCGVEEGRKILLDTSSEMNSYPNKIPAMLKALAEITLINLS